MLTNIRKKGNKKGEKGKKKKKKKFGASLGCTGSNSSVCSGPQQGGEKKKGKKKGGWSQGLSGVAIEILLLSITWLP